MKAIGRSAGGRRRVAAPVVIALAVGMRTPAAAAQWGERWTRNMVSSATNLPAAFRVDSPEDVAWVAELGHETYGSPIVAGGRVLVGTNNRRPRDARRVGDRGVLMCFDEADGRLLWQLVTPKRTGDVYLDWPGAGLCSPPTVEGDRLWVLDNRGELLCLDAAGLANGNDGPFTEEAALLTPEGEEPVPLGGLDADVIWRLDLKVAAGIYTHDAGHASVLLVGDVAYLNTCNGVDNTHRRIRHPEAATLIAVDARTGRLLARDGERIGPRIVHCQWSSPAMMELAGRPHLVFGGADAVVYMFEALPSPPPESAPVVLRCVARLDLDPGTAKERACEWNGRREAGGPSTIHGMPVCVAGAIFVTVGGDRWWGKREAWLVRVEPSVENGEIQLRERWRYPLVRHCLSTPAVLAGLVFVPDSSGRLHAVDAATGEGVWVRELDGEVSGSPLVADGRVYVGTHRGTLYAWSADRAGRALGETRLDSAIWGTPAAAHGRLYVATMRRLYAVRGPREAAR
ncbi:MAG: PQQ-binding-like beta-propeller repeat protein [Kiritimatiellae bacterium]|nr:PQQ-binding-like beta-propeller repeat protein [Kiritimatiellia bacterium]